MEVKKQMNLNIPCINILHHREVKEKKKESAPIIQDRAFNLTLHLQAAKAPN